MVTILVSHFVVLWIQHQLLKALKEMTSLNITDLGIRYLIEWSVLYWQVFMLPLEIVIINCLINHHINCCLCIMGCIMWIGRMGNCPLILSYPQWCSFIVTERWANYPLLVSLAVKKSSCADSFILKTW